MTTISVMIVGTVIRKENSCDGGLALDVRSDVISKLHKKNIGNEFVSNGDQMILGS